MLLIIFKVICIVFGCYCCFKKLEDIPNYFTAEGRKGSEYTQEDLQNSINTDLPDEYSGLILNIVNFILFSWVIIQVALGAAVMCIAMPLVPAALMTMFKTVWLIWGIVAFIFECLHIFNDSDYKIKWQMIFALSLSSAIYYGVFVVTLLATFN